MKKLLPLILTIFSSCMAFAQANLTGSPYQQNFNSMLTSGTPNNLPAGWALFETGSNANLAYITGNGSSNAGDTYSFGSAFNERALGGLQSGSLIPMFGAYFTNSSGSTVTSVTISYTGEQWRLGTLARADRLDFQYSLDATALNTGTWTDLDQLDFSTPDITGTVGLRNGNIAPYRTALSATISGLNIAPGASLFIRWTDFNASGADDALAVDDFQLAFVNAPVDNTPPVNAADFPKFENITETSVDLSSALDEAGTTYYVLIPVSGTAPTSSAQVKAGQDGNGAAAFKSGSISVPAGTTGTITIPGLSHSTAYALYVVSEDAAASPNLQSTFTTLNFSTLSPPVAFTAAFPFTNVSTASGTTDPTPVPAVAGITFSPFTAIGTPANPNAGGRFSFTNWPLGATNGVNTFTGAVNPAQYYQVTVTPAPGGKFSINSIDFKIQRSSTGIRQYVVRSSADGFTANLPASIDPASPVLSVTGDNIFQISDASTTAAAGSKVALGAAYTNLSTPLTFRFYGFNAEGTTGTFSIDDVNLVGISGTASADITAPMNLAGFPKIENINAASADLQSSLNETGTTYYVLIPASGTAPTTAAQVKAGQDGTGAAAFKSGSFAVAANSSATASISGLAASTAYNVYVVSQDAAPSPNLQSTFTTLNFTTSNPTPVANPIIISQFYEGTSVNKWIELTNLSGSPVNTASLQLKLALYGISGDSGTMNITATPSQVVNLTVTIPAYGTVLIGNTGNGSEVSYLTAASAAQTSNSVINFNGNDAVALLDASNNILDAFGQGINAKDASYVRSLTVTSPSAVFNANDWVLTDINVVQNAEDLDDANRLGVHVVPDLPECISPANQATALAFSAVGTKTITLNFTRSDAGEYLIIRSLNSSLTAAPVDGTVYNAGTSLGGGTVAGRTVGNSFTDSNLPSGTTFFYFIYAVNSVSCDGGPKYLTVNPLTGTQATTPLPVCATPLAQATNFNISFSNYNAIQGSFTPASGADEFLMIMSKDSTLSALPLNQTSYAIGDTIGKGIVIRKGAQGNFSRSNLEQNTDYFFYIFSVNSNCSGGPLYLTSAPLTGRQRTGILNANALNYYFGNLHAHSSYSDGNKDDTSKKPEDDYAFAKNSRNMDFLGLSEHNHTQAGMRLANWQPGRIAAQNATSSDFVALHGMEWGVISGGGHVLVYGVDSLMGWEPGEHQIYVPKNTYTGTTGLFNAINRHGLNAIATLAHPNTSDYNNIATTYNALADSAIVGTALASGPAFSTNVTYSDPASSMSYLSYYNRMLARGYRLGASIDHDNHNMTFGRHTRARLVVLAPSLTENDLLDGLKKMRFYASEDSAAKITYTINDQPVGSAFTGSGFPRITVSGATTSPITSIAIIYGTPGNGIIPTTLVSSSASTLSYSDSTLNQLATGYYYADIREADGSRIITSPIWYTRNDSIRVEQVITFNPLPAKTYGDADFDPAATSSNNTIPVSYTSSDTNIASIVNGKVHIVGAGTVTITAAQVGNGQYKPAISKTQQLVIAPKAITVSIQPKEKEYGSADPALTYTSSPALIGTDTFTGSLVRAAGEDAGSYAITKGTLILSSNYTLTADSSALVITKKAILVNIDPKEKEYGSPDPALTYTSSPALVGTDAFTGSLVRVPGENAGSYAITKGTLALSSNYILTADSATLVINKKAILAKADPKEKVYGSPDPALTYTFSPELISGDSFTGSLTRAAGENAGSYAISAGTLALSTNYTLAVDSSLLTITQKALTITADDKTRPFGSPNPVFTAKYSGFANGEDASALTTAPELSTTATQTSPVGNYPISVGGASSTNYLISYIAGTLTVGQAEQTITFAPLPAKTFGDADFALTASGGASGNPVTYTSSNTGVATITGNTVHIVSAGSTTITASQAGSANYTAATNVVQELTVNKATATLTLSNLSQANDGTEKPITVTTNPVGLTGVSVTYNGLQTPPLAVGTYSVNAVLENINYTALPVSGTLNITQQQALKVQYRNADKSLTDKEGKPHLKLLNNGTTAVPYSQLTARYWITPENFTGSLGIWIDYAQIGNNKVTTKYVALSSPRVNALGYIEYGFTSAAGSLPVGANSGEIQSRFANSDWTDLNEVNDHSIGTNTTYADKTTITLYRNGVLIWGTEPAAESPLTKLKIYSEGKSNGNSKSISTTVDIRNEGNVPLDFGDITARYWFTSEGTSPLNFSLDHAKKGSTAVSGNFIVLNPAKTNANVYLELKVKPGTFYPLSSTGDIQYRINKNDWSSFIQTNDHSFKAGSLAENPKMTIYYRGQLVYGTEPASLGAPTYMSTEAPEKLSFTPGNAESVSTIVYPNPSYGSFTLTLGDDRSGPFKAVIYNSAGRPLDTYSGNKTGSFSKQYQLQLEKGMYYMIITWKDHKDYKTILIN